MSVHLVPRWQRTVLRWFLERQLRKGVRSLPCPQCQGTIPTPHRLSDEALWEAVVVCPACAHACSILETVSYRHKWVKEEFAEEHADASPRRPRTFSTSTSEQRKLGPTGLIP